MSEVRVRYKNWKGEVEVRRIVPVHLHYGHNQWHPEDQHLLDVFEVGKKVSRSFAVKDILEWDVPEEDDTPILDDLETDKLLLEYGFERDDAGSRIYLIYPGVWLAIEDDGSAAVQTGTRFEDVETKYIALPVVVKCLGDIRRLLSALGHTLTKKD